MFDAVPHMHDVAFVGADYAEFKPETFRGFFVSFGVSGPKEPERFSTSDEAAEWAGDRAEVVHILSSVDNLAADRRRASATRGD